MMDQAKELYARAQELPEDAREAFLTDANGRDHRSKLRIGFDADHKITAYKVDTIANLGAYMSLFASVTPTYLHALLHSGQPTLEETLNSLPQVQPGFGRTSNNPGNGTAAIDLRGIGSGRTLVMLNGRRMSPAGIGSSVDINSLPSVLMERVEVITGGATTVYGADAIAGVVNFITRKDFDGFSMESSYYATEHGDSNILDINLAWGHEFTNGNITLFGGWLDREPLWSARRRPRRISRAPGRGRYRLGARSPRSRREHPAG